MDAFKGHDISGAHHSGASNLGAYANICMGDPELGDLTIAEMSPEDIRAELKRYVYAICKREIFFAHFCYCCSFRLYTQLEILKNKNIRQDNPHISKRRGGRKVAHRRFSLQVRCSF